VILKIILRDFLADILRAVERSYEIAQMLRKEKNAQTDT
jgi:hypothetical protein